MITRRRFPAGVSGALGLLPLRAAEHDPDFVKAMGGGPIRYPQGRSGSTTLYHFRPLANWANDPNATIIYKGWSHLFYQLNRFAANGGSQHWGSARSRDLVNWEDDDSDIS